MVKISSLFRDEKNVEASRIIITHGGPASFIMPLQIGKIPIVVPRQKKFDEHVNDHQLEFSKNVAERMKNIIPVYDITDLKEIILRYDYMISEMNIGNISNNNKFNNEFEKIIEEIV